MTDRSLDAAYFDGIFAHDDDPWSLASSAYEDAKFARTIAAIDDRRYAHALEIGCAHGVLTTRLAPLCDALLAVDISRHAVDQARARCAALPQVDIARGAAPTDLPHGRFDLIVLSEIVYYWSDADIVRTADALRERLASGARLLLVHYLRETDYPQTGDAAVAKLRTALGDAVVDDLAERTPDYRLDRWRAA